MPKRGIGKTTIQRLTDAANQLGIPLWDVVSDPKRCVLWVVVLPRVFSSELVNDLKVRSRDVAPSELIQQVMEKAATSVS